MRHNVIDRHIAGWEHDTTPGANAFLLAVERVFVRSVVGQIAVVRQFDFT